MATPDTVEHLSAVEAENMHILQAAMTGIGVDVRAVTARGLAGANGLPALVRHLNP